MMSIPEMPCQELVEVITDYLEGSLPEPNRTRFEEHLGVCPGCRAYLEQMRQTMAMTGSVSEASLEPVEQAQLQTLYREWKGG